MVGSNGSQCRLEKSNIKMLRQCVYERIKKMTTIIRTFSITFYFICVREFIVRRQCLGQYSQNFTVGGGWR